MTSNLETDTTGRSFLSYRRSRSSEAKLLVEAQHDVGIPTWQDLSQLDEGHTDSILRETLADRSIASALCWLTPDIESSSTITRTELPCILKRIDGDKPFFLVPVAAGGLDYADVSRVVGTYAGLHDLGQWNVQKISNDPISPLDARLVAQRVLKRRVGAIHNQVSANLPLRLSLNSRKKPAFESGIAVSMDWTHRFDGRIAGASDWVDYLLPALECVAQTCSEEAHGRKIEAEGFCSLPASIALGATFLATRGIDVSWRQLSPGRSPQLWSIGAIPTPSGFFAHTINSDVGANDLAVLVSVTSSVETAFSASRPSLPKFRGIVSVRKDGAYPHSLDTPGQASDVVRVLLEELRRSREELQPRGVMHLFLAVPAGLAMMIGQILNTFGPVQTYEHMPMDAVGIYRPAVLLNPSV